MTTTTIQPLVWKDAVQPDRDTGVDWSTEASTLLLAPGSWPMALELKGWATFNRQEPDWGSGDDLAGWWYSNYAGERLLVIND